MGCSYIRQSPMVAFPLCLASEHGKKGEITAEAHNTDLRHHISTAHLPTAESETVGFLVSLKYNTDKVRTHGTA